MIKRVYSKSKLTEILHWYADVWLMDDYLYGGWEKIFIGRDNNGIYYRVPIIGPIKKLDKSEKEYTIGDIIIIDESIAQVDENIIVAIAEEWFL